MVDNPTFKWNLLDVLCLVSSIVELLSGSFSAISKNVFSFIKLLRILRVARVLRLLHTVRAFRGIRKLVIAVKGALLPLAWALVLQIILMYIFTIFINTGIVHYYRTRIDDHDMGEVNHTQPSAPDVSVHTSSHAVRVKEFYGGVAVTMGTLFMSVTGGDWTVMAEPVFELSWIFYVIWYTYTAFVIFGLLNVFTGAGKVSK